MKRCLKLEFRPNTSDITNSFIAISSHIENTFVLAIKNGLKTKNNNGKTSLGMSFQASCGIVCLVSASSITFAVPNPYKK